MSATATFWFLISWLKQVPVRYLLASELRQSTLRRREARPLFEWLERLYRQPSGVSLREFLDRQYPKGLPSMTDESLATFEKWLDHLPPPADLPLKLNGNPPRISRELRLERGSLLTGPMACAIIISGRSLRPSGL
jgi:hypothetical protein